MLHPLKNVENENNDVNNYLSFTSSGDFTI